MAKDFLRRRRDRLSWSSGGRQVPQAAIQYRLDLGRELRRARRHSRLGYPRADMENSDPPNPALTVEDVIGCLLSGGPRISGPEPLGRPGLSDLILGRRFFRATIWDGTFRSAGPEAQSVAVALLFEKNPGISKWFHDHVSRHGTASLLLLAAALRVRERR